MPRDHKPSEIEKIAKIKRQRALERLEFRHPSVPRVAADGATSFPVKAADPDTERLVEEFLAKRRRAG